MVANDGDRELVRLGRPAVGQATTGLQAIELPCRKTYSR